jgi:hypothetical protein
VGSTVQVPSCFGSLAQYREAEHLAQAELTRIRAAFPELKDKGLRIRRDQETRLPEVRFPDGTSVWGSSYLWSQFQKCLGIYEACGRLQIRLSRREIIRRLKRVRQWDRDCVKCRTSLEKHEAWCVKCGAHNP